MKALVIFTILFSSNIYGQDWNHLFAKLDTVTKKYGFVDSTGNYVIAPEYDEVRNFISKYTSARIDTLWGIIDTKGSFIIEPKFGKLSSVYRGHFIEGGQNMKFRDINEVIKYEYLYIPGPFEKFKQFKNDPEAQKLEDFELYLRVLEVKHCHYYKMYRPYNWIAIETEKYGKMTIDFVLNQPDRVRSWIEKDKQFEKDFEEGKIGCCGHGSFWWGE